MGAIWSCCKPKEKKYVKINIDSAGSNNSNTPAVLEVYGSKKDYRNFILNEINKIVFDENSKRKDLISHGGEITICDIDADTMDGDLMGISEGFPFVEPIITLDELESILSSLSNSDPTENEDPDSIGSPESDSMSRTEDLFRNNTHISWSESQEDFPRLRCLLEKGAQLQIITDYIDSVDENGNSAVSVALLASNSMALICLIKQFYAQIPIFVNDNGHHYLFLIFLIMNRNIRINDKSPVLEIIKEICKYAQNQAYIEKCFFTIDPTCKVSFLHYLVEMYLMGQAPPENIFKCIQIVIDLLPKSLHILCQINRQSQFKINVIGRILCCANTQNIRNVSHVLDYIRNVYPNGLKEGKQVYLQIISAHNSTEIQQNLLPFFAED